MKGTIARGHRCAVGCRGTRGAGGECEGPRRESDDRRSAAQRSGPDRGDRKRSCRRFVRGRNLSDLHTMVSTVTRTEARAICARPSCARCFRAARSPARRRFARWRSSANWRTSPRGVYCGAIGYFAPDGSAHFNVAIRTLTIEGWRGRTRYRRRGGRRIRRAARNTTNVFSRRAITTAARRPLELIETLSWSPDGGFVRLDLHLARMARSASGVWHPFDREAASFLG